MVERKWIPLVGDLVPSRTVDGTVREVEKVGEGYLLVIEQTSKNYLGLGKGDKVVALFLRDSARVPQEGVELCQVFPWQDPEISGVSNIVEGFIETSTILTPVPPGNARYSSLEEWRIAARQLLVAISSSTPALV